jgi:hypothetical protein
MVYCTEEKHPKKRTALILILFYFSFLFLFGQELELLIAYQ